MFGVCEQIGRCAQHQINLIAHISIDTSVVASIMIEAIRDLADDLMAYARSVNVDPNAVPLSQLPQHAQLTDVRTLRPAESKVGRRRAVLYF